MLSDNLAHLEQSLNHCDEPLIIVERLYGAKKLYQGW